MVSGGPDSVALARALHRLNVPLSLVYVDHGTRPETAEEGRFVLQLGEQLGVSASVVYCEPASGSEQDLRDARYAAVSALPGDALATGHTLSDQAETVLLRMIRGAGIVGLAGIPWRRERIIRPMLGITREHVLAWLDYIDQPYRTDPTNASLDPTRNRVRHRLMPMLSEEFNPQIARSLARWKSTRPHNRYDRSYTPRTSTLDRPVWCQFRPRGCWKLRWRALLRLHRTW